MKRTATGKKNMVLRLATVLLVLVLITSCMTSGLLAGYATQDSARDSAAVANYVFDVQNTEKLYFDITGIQMPGDEVTYRFRVTNTNARGTSEVDEEYSLELQLRGSLPLVCELTGNGETLELDGSRIDAAPGLVEEQGKTYTFQAAAQGADEYTLTVSWPEEENDLKFSRAGLAELVLSVKAEQLD